MSKPCSGPDLLTAQTCACKPCFDDILSSLSWARIVDLHVQSKNRVTPARSVIAVNFAVKRM